MGRDLFITFSLANLCYLRIWAALLTYTDSDAFLRKSFPTKAELLAVVLNVFVLGMVLWLVLRAARSFKADYVLRLTKAAYIVFLGFPLNSLRLALSPHVPYLANPFAFLGRQGMIVLFTIASLAVILMPRAWLDQMTRAASRILLIFSPFLLFTLGQVLWTYATCVKCDGAKPSESEPRIFSTETAETRDQPPRVLWVIFDDWDHRLTFDDRDSSLSLPEIDRFRQHSLYATRAFSPSEATFRSIPSLTTGKLVTGTTSFSPDDLLLSFADSESQVRWSVLPNVFSRAQERGFRTAVVGWALPYCRVFEKSLTFCEWWEMSAQHNSMGDTFLEILANQPRSLAEGQSFSIFENSLTATHKVRTYQEMLETARTVATRRDLNLIFLHFPVPHSPHVYNRRSGKFDLRYSTPGGYLDSLELVDRTLGELRKVMEETDTWGLTTVLLSSDHYHRNSQAIDGKTDQRVPFLLKLAHQRRGMTYERPFNTLFSQELLLSILRGRLGDAQAVVDWLDHHPSVRNTIGDGI